MVNCSHSYSWAYLRPFGLRPRSRGDPRKTGPVAVKPERVARLSAVPFIYERSTATAEQNIIFRSEEKS